MKPAGQISSVELERLVAFLNVGKSLYIEGHNFAEDHHDSEFFNLLGCHFVSDGNSAGDIWTLKGLPHTFVSDKTFQYGYFPSPRCRADIIAAAEGQLIFNSQDSLGYAAAYSNHNLHYNVITSTFLFAALVNGEGQNSKAELMRRYLQYFEGTLPVEDFKATDVFPIDFSLSQNYPNPFQQTTLINFSLLKTQNSFTFSIFNLLGQEVKKFTSINSVQHDYSLMWDGTDDNHVPVPSGVYIYQLKVGDSSLNRRMNLVR